MSKIPLIDMVGKVVGDLTVLRREEVHGNVQAHWRCSCTCGGETVVGGWELRKGRVTSCEGCEGK